MEKYLNDSYLTNITILPAYVYGGVCSIHQGHGKHDMDAHEIVCCPVYKVEYII